MLENIKVPSWSSLLATHLCVECSGQVVATRIYLGNSLCEEHFNEKKELREENDRAFVEATVKRMTEIRKEEKDFGVEIKNPKVLDRALTEEELKNL